MKANSGGCSLRSSLAAALIIMWMSAALPLVAQDAPVQAPAAENGVRTFRDWESFSPGAWKQVRVHREVFDEHEKVASSSITDTKTTLVDKDEKGFTLSVEVSVEVAGQEFPSPPQTVWYGYNGETK